jgi:hypothetical protein
MKPHIKELGCYKQVANIIGEANAQKELWKVVHCKEVLELVGNDHCDWENELNCCFTWEATPQGFTFWSLIDDWINPYE